MVNQEEGTSQPTGGGSASIIKAGLAEGYSYATLIGWVTGASTGTWLATSTVTGVIAG